MPQKSKHDFKKKYPYVHVGTLVKEILIEDNCFFTEFRGRGEYL